MLKSFFIIYPNKNLEQIFPLLMADSVNMKPAGKKKLFVSEVTKNYRITTN